MEASSPPTQGPAKESDTPTTLALDRGAVTSPLKLARASEAPSDANLGHAALGVACALRVLLCEYETPYGGTPPVLNELRYPLCDYFAPTGSFAWIQRHRDASMQMPPHIAVRRRPPHLHPRERGQTNIRPYAANLP